MTNDEPRTIGESLAFVTRNLGLARPAEVSALMTQWSTLVGDSLATHTQPASLRKGILTIEVTDGAWGAPLNYLRDTLIDRANAVLGGPVISSIKVVVRPQSGVRKPGE